MASRTIKQTPDQYRIDIEPDPIPEVSGAGYTTYDPAMDWVNKPTNIKIVLNDVPVGQVYGYNVDVEPDPVPVGDSSWAAVRHEAFENALNNEMKKGMEDLLRYYDQAVLHG